MGLPCPRPPLARPYRMFEGQTYGWDCVIAAGAAWFLDDGDGSEGYVGTLRGRGIPRALRSIWSASPRRPPRSRMTEICDAGRRAGRQPAGHRRAAEIAVGYDSGNGVLAAFDIADDGSLHVGGHDISAMEAIWCFYPDTGELVTGDHDRSVGPSSASSSMSCPERNWPGPTPGSPVQSVLFPSPGLERDFYLCSFTTVSRVCTVGT